MGRTIALATPVFFALIAIEWLVGRVRGRDTYRLNDSINSLSLGVISQVIGLFTKLLVVGIYAWVHQNWALAELPTDAWWVWVLGVVVYDFCYYWNHRLGHESAVFWAAHVVHHQSQEYNLTTALRQTGSGALLGWVFYLPMAIAGFPTEVFVVAAIVDLLYQYWIHTEQVGKLGWFDRWFASPSNHRVHHAVNDRYLDRNYGGIFMAWDRMFGTFVEEDERCVYGTRAPLDSWDPLWANFEVYADLARKSWHASRFSDRLLVWIKPPGWQPASGATWHTSHFDVATVRRYDPPMGRGARAFALGQFALVVVGTVPLLWYAAELSLAALVAWSALVIGLLWFTGAVMQGRIRVRTALAIELVVAVAVLFAARDAAASAAEANRAAPPVVVDDPAVQSALVRARTSFLASSGIDRLQATVLVESPDGRWLRGSVEGSALAYPASCVKLAYLVAAAHWCAANGRAPGCLDVSVRPMIVESDNVATGVVVDAVTGAPNGPVEGANVDAWIDRRLYSERVLDAAGLLAGQRAINKTYPTNSGEEPTGLEALIRERLGRNAMSPDGAARLMLAVARGTVEPQASGYMQELLARSTFSPQSAVGGGLPPGTRLLGKAGWAYDTLEDIAYAELPNGRRFVLAVFTNGYDQQESEPGSLYRLNPFMETLVGELGLTAGLPTPRVLAPAPAGGGAYTVALAAPEAGWYELAAWYEAAPDAAAIATWRIEHAGGESVITLDQRTWGSRWIPLGNVQLDAGGGRVTVSGRDGRLVPGQLRVTRWIGTPPSAEAPAETESERH